MEVSQELTIVPEKGDDAHRLNSYESNLFASGISILEILQCQEVTHLSHH